MARLSSRREVWSNNLSDSRKACALCGGYVPNAWRIVRRAIPLASFQRAVQYITPDGHHATAAEASFLVLSHARGIWLTLYRNGSRYSRVPAGGK